MAAIESGLMSDLPARTGAAAGASQFPNREWSGPFRGPRIRREPDTRLDSVASVLGRLLRRRIHRGGAEHQHPFPASLGRSLLGPHVLYLGRHAASPPSSWALPYGIPGALHNPNEWSSLFIAVALWGGSWALADVVTPTGHDQRAPSYAAGAADASSE